MELSPKDKQHYFNLKKGYEGELMFDSLTEKLQCECLILNDLLLKLNSTLFQIDTIIIIPEMIYLFEVKNFEGDYLFENERLYKKPKSEITNPLTQLSRGESLFRQLLQSLGHNIHVEASLVFINPEFTLYQAPQNKPIILPTQVNRCLRKINSNSSTLKDRHRILADKLISLYIPDSPFKQIPNYNFDHLHKGIGCGKCNSLSNIVINTKCVCQACGYEEIVEYAVMRLVKEAQLLFPNQAITTNTIHSWCKIIDSKKRIRLILDKNFKSVGNHRWTYYEEIL
ncbi:nuclease-related domain-containing protein [Niallia sp. Krafla_26]|uniref:nuclease-related domain-containing protein n=1 Tax=Niallia sp. Krafla_26 TaxID=3064703 RepID=UPI003D175C28